MSEQAQGRLDIPIPINVNKLSRGEREALVKRADEQREDDRREARLEAENRVRREEHIARAKRHRESKPRVQRMREAIDKTAANLASHGVEFSEARRLVVDAVEKGERKRG